MPIFHRAARLVRQAGSRIAAAAAPLARLAAGATLRVGLAILLVEAIVLGLLGAFYLRHLDAEMEQRAAARIETPGRLMQEGLLRLASVADPGTMTRLVGEDLVEAMVVGRSLNIFYATNPGMIGRSAAEVPGLDVGWFAADQRGPLLVSLRMAGADALVSVFPLQLRNSVAPFLFSYVKIDATALAGQRDENRRAVVSGSVLCLLVSGIVIFTLLSKREAQLASRAKSDFLAMMSHELRTPLNGVIGVLDLLRQGTSGTKARELATLGQRSAAELLRLIDDILDFAKAEVGALKLEPGPFSPAALLDEVADLLAARAADRGLAIAVFANPQVPALLSGDAIRFKQLLFNLMGNAIKFTARGHVAATLAVEGDVTDRCSLRLEVSDTGPGMSETQQARLFRPFVQLDPTGSRRAGGVGLGLSICRRIVALMDGTIGVRSTPGEGSVFWVRLTLPVVAPAPIGAPDAPAAGPCAAATRNAAAVLVADDNLVNRIVLRNILEHLGYRADIVEDGAAAWRAYGARAYDILLTDCHMPEMDGFALARRIRAAERVAGRPRLPIIAVTAGIADETVKRWQEAGMDDGLAKPIGLAEVARILATWLPAPGVAPAGAADAPSRPPVLDPVPVIAASRGDAAERNEILALFLSSTQRLVEKLVAASAAGDLPEAEEAAHAASGIAYAVGAYDFGGICATIERHLRAGERAAAAAVERELAPAFDRLRVAIAAL